MAKSKTGRVTPSRQQFLDIKAQYPDAIVFFRLGDFYETFDEDAEIAARELDLVLTSRPQGKNQRTPMAGVPHHAAEGYIARLISKGYKVALCEQVGTEPVNGLMPREVVRLFTAGTVIEPGMLDAARNNYLASVICEDERAGLAYADITTGEFAATVLENRHALLEELSRLAPAELLVPENESISFPEVSSISTLPDWRFELGTARQTLLNHFGVTSLDAFGCENKPLAARAAGGVLFYLQETQKGNVAQIQRLATYSADGFMALGMNTRRNLELTETIAGQSFGSLLHVLEKTVTPMGARLLRQRLARPLLDIDDLNERLDQVESFFEDALLRADTRTNLKSMPDLERLTNRVLSSTATPRDLDHIGQALTTIPELRSLLADQLSLQNLAEKLDPCPETVDLISRAIVAEAPANLNKMGVICPGFSAELDNIVARSRAIKDWEDRLHGMITDGKSADEALKLAGPMP